MLKKNPSNFYSNFRFRNASYFTSFFSYGSTEDFQKHCSATEFTH